VQYAFYLLAPDGPRLKGPDRVPIIDNGAEIHVHLPAQSGLAADGGDATVGETSLADRGLVFIERPEDQQR